MSKMFLGGDKLVYSLICTVKYDKPINTSNEKPPPTKQQTFPTPCM